MTTTRVLSGLLLTLALGCSARGGSGGGGGGGDTDAGNGGVSDVSGGGGGVSCATLCGRLEGVAGCGADSISACVEGCQELRGAPAQCQGAVGAVLSCAQTSPVACMGDNFPFTGCTSQFTAFGTCLFGAMSDAGSVTPPRDAGTVTPPPEDAGGPQPPRDAGNTNPLIAPECQSCAFTTCMAPVQSCLSDPTCLQCLSAGVTPACRTNPGVAAVIACACTGTCASPCRAGCESLGL